MLSLYMTFTLDAIWNLRNQILYNGNQANIIATARNIENAFQEFASAIGWIMLNADAAISHEFSTLDVVARDDNGEIVQIWA